MISVIIASYKEPKTIRKAIESIAHQLSSRDEIIVIAPDKETREAAIEVKTGNVKLKVLKDSGKGKPSALNTAIKHTKNNLLLLTDGDVEIDRDSIKHLISKISSDVGIVTGRVVSSNTRNNCLGFWAYVLTESFHNLRLLSPSIATGYLYLIKKSLFPKLPEKTLADDAYISYSVLEKGYKIIYEPESKVYVKYPTTLPDWLRQKKRTAGRIYQLNKKFNLGKYKFLQEELKQGLFSLSLINSTKEFFWLIGLWYIKLYLWARVLFDYRLWNRSFSKLWERVESTK